MRDVTSATTKQKDTPALAGDARLSPHVVAAFAICAVTLVSYANVVGSFYIYADDIWVYSKSLANDDLGTELWLAITTIGRPTGVFIERLQALTVEASLDLIVLQRLLSLAAVAAIAYVVYLDLPIKNLERHGLGWLGIGAALFLVLLPAAQVHAVFAALLGSSLGLILAFVSYRWLARPFGWLWTTVALIFCLTIYQGSPWLILVAFALDVWRRYEDGAPGLRKFLLRRGALVVSLLVAASMSYAVSFKLLSALEDQLYPRAVPFLAMLSGDFGPFLALLVRAPEGLNVFEIWSYPPYIGYIWHKRYAYYLVVLIAIVALNALAVLAAASSEERSRRLWVVLGFTGAFLASLAPVIADGFSARQNLYYPGQFLIVLNLAFVISLFARARGDMRPIALVLALALIAQSFMTANSVYASIIRPQLLAIDFVAMKLRESGIAPGPISLAVTMGKTGADCRFEPCLAYFGRRFNADWDWTGEAGFFERVAQRFGYDVVAFGHVQKPADVKTLALSEPLVVIDIDELRAIYAADRIQM